MTDHFSFRWGIPMLDNIEHIVLYDFLLNSYAKLGVTPTEMMFIIHLSQFRYESARGKARPSLMTIGKRMGYNDDQMARRLAKSLDKKGMVIITPHGTEGKPNEYNFSPFSQKAWALWQAERGDVNNDTPIQSYTPTPIQSYSPPLYENIPEEIEDKKKNQREDAPAPQDAPPATGKKKRATRLTIDSLPDHWRDEAKRINPHLDPDRIWPVFVDHWRAAPGVKGLKEDWLATWRNWIRRESQSLPITNTTTNKGYRPPAAPVPGSPPADLATLTQPAQLGQRATLKDLQR